MNTAHTSLGYLHSQYVYAFDTTVNTVQTRLWYLHKVHCAMHYKNGIIQVILDTVKSKVWKPSPSLIHSASDKNEVEAYK